MADNSSTLLGCLGFYGKPVSPNNCQNCQWSEVCRKVVAKERLKAILLAVQEAGKILRGVAYE